MNLPLKILAIVCFGLPLNSALMAAEVSGTGATLSLAVEPAGFATYPVPSRAAALDYYLMPDFTLGLNYARGSAEQLLATREAELLLLRGRYFFGAVSHINAGAGIRRLTYNYEVQSTEDDHEGVSNSMTAAVAEISFGNHLRFGPLQIGCDWFGVILPIAKISQDNNFPADADIAAGEQRADDEAEKQVAMVPSLEFMRLFVGVVF